MSTLSSQLIERLINLTKSDKISWTKQFHQTVFVYKFNSYKFILEYKSSIRSVDGRHCKYYTLVVKNQNTDYQNIITNDSVIELYNLVNDVYTKQQSLIIQGLIDELNVL